MQIVLGSRLPSVVDFTPETWCPAVNPNRVRVYDCGDGRVFYESRGASNFTWMVIGSNENHGGKVWGYDFDFPDRKPRLLENRYIQNLTWECYKDDSRDLKFDLRLSKPMILDQVLYNGRFQPCAMVGISVTRYECKFWTQSNDVVESISASQYILSKGDKPQFDETNFIDSAIVGQILSGSYPKGMLNSMVSVSSCEISTEGITYKVGVLQGKQQHDPSEIVFYRHRPDVIMKTTFEVEWVKYTLTAVELLHLYAMTSKII